VPQSEAAKRLGVIQPCLNDLLRGRIGKFSLDTLAALATRAGLAVHMEITMAAQQIVSVLFASVAGARLAVDP